MMIEIKAKHVIIMMMVVTLLLTGCATRATNINARIWNTQADHKIMPELNDPIVKVPWLANRKSFGVAFSGGGTRSASATLGELRALKKLGWLDEVQYISAISGGSWVAVPFTYLPDDYSEDAFLGPYIPPSALKFKDLESAEDGSMTKVIATSSLFWRYLLEGSKGRNDETYSRTIGNRFLSPFGLNDRNKSFSFHKGAFDANFKNENSINKGKMDEHDFYFAKDNRPYLIVGGTLLGKDSMLPDYLLQIEMTGLYTGVRKRNAITNKHSLGGGYVESYAYDSTLNEKIADDVINATISNKGHRFTLSDVVGVSGAAPQQLLRTLLHVKNAGFPEYTHWPIDFEKNEEGKIKETGKEYAHGDGGHIDNLGLMPLLVRQIKNIIVFVNTPSPFSKREQAIGISDDIVSYFQPVPCNFPEPELSLKNIVFEQAELYSLISKFEEQKDINNKHPETKVPLHHCAQYSVRENDSYGIQPYKANLCWIYLDRNEKWLDLVNKGDLEADYKSKLTNREHPFERFPHYKTFEENPPFLIDLLNEQVNALSNLAAWSLCASQNEIAESLIADGLKLPINSMKCN